MKLSTRFGPATKAVVAAATLLLASSPVWAHITNQDTLYPDIAKVPQSRQIVLLTALGVIPETPTFNPNALLTRTDLAAWAALTHHAAPGGESPDIATLEQKGTQWVSGSGNATAADINQAIFDGWLPLRNPDQQFTKAEAAGFIAAHLSPALLKQLDVQPGPTGIITHVKTGTSPDGDTSYTFEISGQSYPCYDHVMVIGSTNLSTWLHADLTSSYLRKTSDGNVLVYIQKK